MRAILCAVAVLVAAATASANGVKIGSKSYESIQAACEDAKDGDTIVVSKGVYYENVTLSVPNVKIVGKKAVIDGTVGTSHGGCLVLLANGCSVEGMAFRNGLLQVWVAATGCRISKCTLTNAAQDAIYVDEYANTTITGCRITGAGDDGIDSRNAPGNPGTISKNTILRSGARGILLSGSTGALVEKNVVRTTYASPGIDVTANGSEIRSNTVSHSAMQGIHGVGAGIVVTSNRVTWTGGNGIDVSGEDADIEKNILGGCHQGVVCSGAGAKVLRNAVAGTSGEAYAFSVSGVGIDVSDNTAKDGFNYSIGFDISGTGGTVAGNTATNFPDVGFSLQLTNSTVSRCTAKECGAGRGGSRGGFFVSAPGTTLADCVAQDCDEIGFFVQSGTLLRCVSKAATRAGFYADGTATFTDCSAFDSGGAGFVNDGDSVTLTGGTFLRNRQDVTRMVNWAATWSATPTGVHFETGGFDTECDVVIAND